MNLILSMGRTWMVILAGLAMGGWIIVCPIVSGAGIPEPRKVTIMVRETSLVRGPEILLGEIARIESGSFLKEILETLALENSPKPGKIKQLNKNRLISLIRSQTGLPENILIETPEKIYVKRDSQQVQQQKVREQVDIFLAEYFTDREYELEQLVIKELRLYPQGAVDLGISQTKIDKKGNLSLVMDIMIAGNLEDRIRISGKVAVFANILCAVADLAKGKQIFKGDVYFARKNLFSLRGDVVLENQAVEGKILKRSVKKDDYVKFSSLEENPLIQKGDIVTLVARSRNLLIVTTGISQEDGYADKLIKVENIKSGKIVRGLVKEGSTVEVIY
jgi:flagellar basal body P-ring formation protein FlgA